MNSRIFEQELETAMKSLNENPAPANGESRIAPKFTAISGEKANAQNAVDPLDGEHLIAVAQQRFDLARKTLEAIELEYLLERTKLIQSINAEIADLNQKGQRRVAALERDYEQRKQPAKRMMALVSPLSDATAV